MLADITARQVPEIRGTVLGWVRDEGPTGYLAHFVQRHRSAGIDIDPDQERHTRDQFDAHLRTAELFYVSPALTDLAAQAGASLPEYRLHPEDLPAPVGLCCYGSPIGRIGDGLVRMIEWAPAPGGIGVSFWGDSLEFWSDFPATPQQILDRFGVIAYLHQAVFPLREAPRWATRPGTLPDPQIAAAELEAAERAVLSTWLLMGQTLTHSETVHPPRSAHRRLARMQAPLTATRYTDLRRLRTMPGDHPQNDGKPGRDHDHQWVVRGHWRNQYYPSRDDHRPLWIDPHIKGPEGAPLLGGERVHLLRR